MHVYIMKKPIVSVDLSKIIRKEDNSAEIQKQKMEKISYEVNGPTILYAKWAHYII